MTNIIKEIIWNKIIDPADKISSVIGLIVFIISFVEKNSWSLTFVLVLIAFALTHYLIKEKRLNNIKFPKMDKREDRTYNVLENYFNKKSIRIIDFLNQDQAPIIEKNTFEDCIIYGPCIFTNMGNSVFDTVNFVGDGKVESILYEITPREKAVGVVGIKDCIFRNCQFKGIGLLGTRDMLGIARTGITSNQ